MQEKIQKQKNNVEMKCFSTCVRDRIGGMICQKENQKFLHIDDANSFRGCELAGAGEK